MKVLLYQLKLMRLLVYNYSVGWGDGTSDANQTANATHSYATAGKHTVTITGIFPAISFSPTNGGDAISKDKIISIDQWGGQIWKTFLFSFFECTNLNIKATDAPNLSKITSLSGMFNGCTSLTKGCSNWDVSTVTSMGGMFSGSGFNGDLSNWDVSKVTSMNYMFFGTTSFNQNIGMWDISSLTSAENMLKEATSFSTTNYDALLKGWSTKAAGETTVPDNVNLNVDSKYCAGKNAKTSLIKKGWAITDKGSDFKACTTGINDNKAKVVSLYPNPAKNNIKIVLETGEIITSIKVFDLLGKKVISKTVNRQNNYQLDITNLKRRAIYIMKIKTNSGVIAKRIITK
jgi:surface protein